jgi:hypothetical protein
LGNLLATDTHRLISPPASLETQRTRRFSISHRARRGHRESLLSLSPVFTCTPNALVAQGLWRKAKAASLWQLKGSPQGASPYLQMLPPASKSYLITTTEVFVAHTRYRGYRLINRGRIPSKAEQRFSFAVACPVECLPARASQWQAGEADSSGVSRQTKNTYLCVLCASVVSRLPISSLGRFG